MKERLSKAHKAYERYSKDFDKQQATFGDYPELWGDYPELKYRDIQEKETMGFWAGLLLGAAIASVLWMFAVNHLISSLI